MAFWKPLLLIIPGGVVIGLVAAQLVEPQETLVTPPPEVSSQSDWARGTEPADTDFAAQDARRVAQQDQYRPDYDWEEEYWPGEREGIYSYYDELEGSGGLAAGEQTGGRSTGYGPNPELAAAESAARAAEQAAEDAAQAAAEAASPPAATISIGPRPTPSPVPPEPRAGEGDLPAIW